MAASETDITPRRWMGGFKKALIVEHPDPSLDEHLRAMGIEPDRITETPDEATLVKLLEAGQHNLIYKRSRVQITERVVEASRNLAAVMLCCIGDDSVDKEACAQRGVMVMNDPVSNGRSVAEMVIGELITLSRRIFDAVIEMNDSVWRKSNKGRYEVLGKRLGLVGLGRIGRQVAQLAQAMGMEVFFYDNAPVPQEVGLAMGYKMCESLDELFRVADFVSVHVSANDYQGRTNEGLIGYEQFRAFGDKEQRGPRIFINLARGVVVRPDDLVQATKDGLVGYAITDVFPEEPRASKESEKAWVNPYAGEPRIFATPHIGAATMEAQPRIAKYVARTTQLFNDYGMIRNCVFEPRGKIDFERPSQGSMLAVVHVDKRGTKKAVDDFIYEMGANNLRSAHIDFSKYGVAYDLSHLDLVLTADHKEGLVQEAAELTGDPSAIRWIRTIPLGD